MTPKPWRAKPTEGDTSIAQIAVAYAGFGTLGLSVGLRGVAWPYIRAGFGLPLDAVGVLVAAATAGSIFFSFNGGLIASRIGVGPLLVVSSMATALGLLGYGVAPAWCSMVLAGLIAGAGSGALHVGMNAHFAANHGVGVVNGLHACFGIGATLGPLIMTAILRAGSSWRWGYGAAGLVMGLVALYFAITHNRWSGSAEKVIGENQSSGRNSLETLRLPIVWVSLLVFFIYTGLESTTGQWAYSLFTEARSVAESTAGFWMSVYWGGLAAGRLILGRVIDRSNVAFVLRLCILGVVIGAGLIWWSPADVVSFLGLALVGFAEGPIFPSLVSGTSRRVAAGHVDNTIGFEVTAASLGVAALTSLAGVLAARRSLEIIGPFLVGCAVLMFILHEIVVRREKNGMA